MTGAEAGVPMLAGKLAAGTEDGKAFPAGGVTISL